MASLNTVTNVNVAGIRRALELTTMAHTTLGQKAADGAKARPTVGQINDVLDSLTTIKLLLENVTEHMSVVPNIENASDNERKIVGKMVDDLLAAGFNISIDDGGGLEESPLKHSADADAICAALASTDSDRLHVYRKGARSYTGWVYLVWGNDVDVISDYTTNLEQYLAAANKLAYELEA